jgi:4-hydroxy-tetrahydrodipicolinate synthase
MTQFQAQPPLQGVFAAAVTPLTASLAPDLDALPALLDLLAERGCHGVLLLGTTGEGTSFSVEERVAILRAGLTHRAAARPALKVLAGTGCASLADAVTLTRAAFDLGADGVVTLPAFYYKGVSAAGLVDFFDTLLNQAVPGDGRLLAYHIPQMSGVGVPDEAVLELRARHPSRFYGMKDSQDELAHTLATLQAAPGFGLFCGSDSLMTDSLAAGAFGTITALANVTAPLNRAVWDAHQRGEAAPDAQARLSRARVAVRGLNGPAAMKAALADLLGLPLWPVRPPLQALTPPQREKLAAELGELLAVRA